MSKKTQRGASGKIEVSYAHEETSSTHIETERSVEIIAKDEKIILIESSSHTNFIKSKESTSSKISYEIEIENVVNYIKEHGSRLCI